MSGFKEQMATSQSFKIILFLVQYMKPVFTKEIVYERWSFFFNKVLVCQELF